MRFRRILVRQLVIIAVTYLSACGAAAVFKERLIFPVRGQERAVEGVPPADIQALWLPIEDDGKVEAWWSPAPGASAERPAPAVMVFHGNGELIDDTVDLARAWNHLGVSALLVEYRGYGRSGGGPSVAGVSSDALRWYDLVAARPEVSRERIYVHGFSLGGGFAAQVAAARPVAGAVMESTFASLPAIARDRFVWLFFSTEDMPSAEIIGGLPEAVPVLITHGRPDPVIGVRHGRLLAEARPAATYVEDDHSHLPATVLDPSLLTDWWARAGADKGLALPAAGSAH